MQGPNVKRLIAHKMSLLMIPPGSGKNALATGIAALMAPGNVGKVAREATAWVEAAIAVVKTAPDNPYGNDDEAIAGELLAEVEKRQQAKGSRR
jgi:hypothetical protein